MDLIRALAREQGIAVQIRLAPWRQTLEDFQNGKVDVAAMYRFTQRSYMADYAIAHELIYHEMFIRKGGAPVRSLADLAGKRILLEGGTYSDEALVDLGLNTNITRTKSEPEALLKLAQGEGDVAVVTETVGRPFALREAQASKISATGPPVLLTEYCFATLKGRRQLIEALNDGMMAVKASGEYDRLYDKWLRTDRSAGLVRKISWVLVCALLVGAWVAVWNHWLRQLVARQTQLLRASEERLRQLNSELEHRVRERTKELEALNQELEAFSYSVSHDLRAPLRGIEGWVQVLQEDYAPLLGEEGAQAVDRLRASSQRMSVLIEALLRLSRLTRQPLTREAVCLPALIKEVWEGLRKEQPSQGAELDLGDLPDCQADPSLLTQVFVNLLENALKFSGRNPHPRIQVGSQKKENGSCVYFVADNGAGFDMRYADKLFGAFQRLHSSKDYPGSGIGLAITYRIVVRHGGRIWTESAVGKGATFFFTLAPD